jgi:hypothetical protein
VIWSNAGSESRRDICCSRCVDCAEIRFTGVQRTLYTYKRFRFELKYNDKFQESGGFYMNNAIVVLGMHRSGTSALTKTIISLGAFGPKNPLPPNSGNPLGYWESAFIVALNDEILASAGSRWNDWRGFDRAWLNTAAAASFHERAIQTLDSEFDGAPLIALKDPRLCCIYPFWGKVLNAADYRATAVLIVRSPLEVAQSLASRDGMPIALGLLLWARYSLDAESNSRDLDRCIVLWSEFLDNWRAGVRKIEDCLGVEFPHASDFSADEIDSMLRHDHRHHRVDDAGLSNDPRIHELVLRIYRALVKLGADQRAQDACAELDALRAEFDAACRLFGPSMVDYEQLILAKDKEIQEGFRSDEVLKADFVSITNERDALIARSSVLQLETAQTRQALDQTKAERDGLGARASELEAQVARVGEALTTAQAERDLLVDQAGVLEAQRAQLDHNLGEATRMREVLLSRTQELEGLLAQSDDLQARTDEERRGSIVAFEQEVRAFNDLLASLRAERDQLAARTEGLEADLSRLHAEVTKYRAGPMGLVVGAMNRLRRTASR